MQQVFITSTGNIILDEVPIPEIISGHVLVRAHYSAISTGTEVATIHARRANPGGDNAPSGYSLTGQVVEVGQGVTGITVGDVVACGGYNIAVHAEFVLVPVNYCVVLPADYDLKQVAYSTIAAISLQAVRLAHIGLGEIVVVIGTGIIGQFAAILARLSGACVVVLGHRNQKRLAVAQELGAERVLLSETTDVIQAVSDLSGGIGADAVLHCGNITSPESLEQALEMTREKGTLVSVGSMPIDMPRRPLFRKELNFVVSRSTGPGRYDSRYEIAGMDYPIAYVRWTGRRNLAECARLIANGTVDVAKLITHTFPFASAPEALELAASHGSETIGISLEYPSSEKQ